MRPVKAELMPGKENLRLYFGSEESLIPQALALLLKRPITTRISYEPTKGYVENHITVGVSGGKKEIIAALDKAFPNIPIKS